MREVARNISQLDLAIDKVKAFVKAKGYPVEIRANNATSKRMAQLGGTFGVWVKEISEYEGIGRDKVHEQLKAKFLARIYISNPIGPEQEQWVELLFKYQEAGEQEKLEKHAKRISLSWAKVHQMSDYMTAIFESYADNGLFLSPLEK